MADFEKAFAYVLKNEGGFVNDPKDAGGATNMGITQKTLSRWRGKSASADDVRNLPLTEAKAIYEKYYWGAMNCQAIADNAIATALFDVGVNMGGPTAIGLLQKAFGIPITRHLDENTLVEIEVLTPTALFSRFIPVVQNRYVDLVLKNPPQIKFLKGWLKRSQRLMELLI